MKFFKKAPSPTVSIDTESQQLGDDVEYLSVVQNAILRASGQSCAVVNHDGIICSVSAETAALFGYQNASAIIDRNIDILIQDMDSSLDIKNHDRREARGLLADGGYLQLEIGIAPIQCTSKQGQVAITIKHAPKLSKRRLSPALRDASSYILDASFDPMFCTDGAGVIAMVNQAAVDEFGWSKEEFIGQNVRMIVGKEHQSRHDSYMQSYINTGERKMIGKKREIQARRKNGTEFVAELGLAEIPQKDAEEHIFCGFIRNLTREKADKAEILEKQNLTNKIIDASFDALFCINQHGIIQMVNQKSCDVFGWTKEEFIGKNICMIMPDEHASNHNTYLSRYLKTGTKRMMGKEREVKARCKDGSTFPCLLGLNEVGESEGGDRIFCGFIRSLENEMAARAEILAKSNLTAKIIDASYDCLFVINQRGIIQMVNERSSKTLGWSREEFIGQNISMIMPEEHAPKHDNYLARYLETGVKNMMGKEREVEARCKDGSLFPCILGLNEVGGVNESDERIFCGFIRSLARERSLEQRASDSEKQNIEHAREILEQKSTILGILDSSFDSLFVITEERIIQMVNQKSCDVFGWTKEEFIGQNINMIMTNAVAVQHNQYVENYFATGVKKMIGKQREVLAKRKDGTTFPAALGLAEPKAAGLIVGFIRDLTQEKAAQAEILQEQLLNTSIIDSSFDGLFVIDHKGIIQRVNKASCEVFGWSREEFVGQNIKMIMPNDHAEKHDSYLSHYLSTGWKKMMGKQREVEARRRDGSSFPCILGLSEVSLNGMIHFVGFVRDVTMQKSLLIAQAEREASDSLLFNILPEHIAYRLKEDPSHIADHYDNTTILFADIVGFTNKASSMSAHSVVSMLNDIFSRFDHLCEYYDLNKVKTIGDCYMITSIPSDKLEHDGCARVCRFALDMLKAIREFNGTGQHDPIDFRVGIANGPVVAGVVGLKRFLFDMWGDAVNVAARMEQSGLAGQIQVTRDVVDRAGSDFTFELRGTLSIKGKGNMDVYMLKGAKPSEKWRHSMNVQPDPRPDKALRCSSMTLMKN